MMQLDSRGEAQGPGFIKIASIVKDVFTNLPRPEKAAGTLVEKLPAMIPPLG
jgi:hypothetical protein